MSRRTKKRKRLEVHNGELVAFEVGRAVLAHFLDPDALAAFFAGAYVDIETHDSGRPDFSVTFVSKPAGLRCIVHVMGLPTRNGFWPMSVATVGVEQEQGDTFKILGVDEQDEGERHGWYGFLFEKPTAEQPGRLKIESVGEVTVSEFVPIN